MTSVIDGNARHRPRGRIWTTRTSPATTAVRTAELTRGPTPAPARTAALTRVPTVPPAVATAGAGLPRAPPGTELPMAAPATELPMAAVTVGPIAARIPMTA